MTANNGERRIAKAGSILLIECACYSDKNIIGIFSVLADFDPVAMRDEFLIEIGFDYSDRFKVDFDEYKFVAFLLSKGFVLEMDYSFIHVSDFRDPDEFLFIR